MGSVLYIFWDGFGESSHLTGQWSNVIIVDSKQPTLAISGEYSVTITSYQPTMQLTGADVLTLGSNQGTYRINLP